MVIVMVLILGAGIFVLSWEWMKDFYGEQKERLKAWLAGFRYDEERGEMDFGPDGGKDEKWPDGGESAGWLGDKSDWRLPHGKPAGWLPREKEDWWLPHEKPAEWLPRGIAALRCRLRLLLQLTWSLGTDRSVRAFELLSVGAALAVTAALLPVISTGLALAAAAVAAFLPYALLKIRLNKIRVQSSREGEILITGLLNNYKINYCNMQKAIEDTAAEIEEAPVSKKLLFNLSKGLNRAGSGRDIEVLLKEFRLSINTSWGNVLARNMYFALSSGMQVTEALSDLADTVKTARKLDEQARRENNEAALMFRYLVPAAYLLAPACSIWMMGMSPEKFLYYQFETEVGLTWFTISSIVYVSGMLASGFLGRGKLDL